MPKKILVLWAKGTATNLGIQALAAGTAELSRMAFGDCEVVFHDHDTDGTPLGKKPILNDVGRRNGDVKRLAREFDLVIDTGSGDSFTDIYGVRRLAVMTYAQRATVRAGVPLILAPQTLGPFKSKLGLALARGSITRASRVYSRDTQSTTYAASALGRHPEAQSADVVFSLAQPKTVERTESVYVNVSGLLWRENPHVNSTAYRQQIVSLVRGLSSAGREVVLFPHVLRVATSREDDVTATEEAAELLSGLATVYIPTNLDDVRSALAGASAVVGARMHACLNALSVGTPAIAWAYSRKFAPLMHDLGWPGHADLREGDVVEKTIAFLTDPVCSRDATASVRASAMSSLQAVASDMRSAV